MYVNIQVSQIEKKYVFFQTKGTNSRYQNFIRYSETLTVQKGEFDLMSARSAL